MQTLQTSLGDFRSFAEGNLWSGKHRYALANGTDYAAASVADFPLTYDDHWLMCMTLSTGGR